MKIACFELGPVATNAFLLWREGNEDAVLVDAPPGAWEAVRPALEEHNLKLSQLLLTHGHWDHMAGAAEVKAQGVETWGHGADRQLFAEPAVMSAFAMPGMDFDPVEIDHWIGEGDRVEVLGAQAEVRHVPGHCPGNVLFYFEDEKLALVGDAIFAGSIGRTDLPGGDFDVLEKAIRKRIYTLPDEVVLLPGHGPSTTVGREKATNPYVPE